MSAHAEAHGGHTEAFERARLGMWLFLGSEIMMFGAFIGSYIVLRMSMPEELVAAAKDQLSVPIAAFNTLVLILSSYTVVRGVNAISKGNKGHCEDMLVLTAALGSLFLVVKGFEYGAKFAHGIGPATNIFYNCYFLMTGFHGFHVLVGIVVLLWLAFYVKKFDQHNYAKIENAALYWHLVDVIWIFLFPIVYLL